MAGRDELDLMGLHLSELRWLASELTGAPALAQQKGWSPRVDLLEADGYFVINAELGGVRCEQVSLSYHPERHSITIRGHRSDTLLSGPDRLAPHLLEIEYGEFSREIELPETQIDLADVRSRLRAGILTIVLPKQAAGRVTVVIEETIIVTPL